MVDRNDVDATIDLDCMEPPTHKGRVLQWSGERIPQPGEMVFCPVEGQNLAGLVVGYFQSYGYLGIKLKVSFRPADDDVICVFGAEIVVNPDEPAEGKAS